MAYLGAASGAAAGSVTLPSAWTSSTSSSWGLPARALGPCPHRSLVVRRQGAQRGAEPPRRGSTRCWSLPPLEPPVLQASLGAEPSNGAGPQPPEPQEPHPEHLGEQQQQGEQQHQSYDGDGGLDEKERTRRARISAANSGKQPWNKGRKHSPETIAKIRARTKAAMSRPDVVNNYKEGVAKHRQRLAEQQLLKPPPPPKPPKAPRERKPSAPKPARADGAQPGDEQSPGAAAVPPPRKRSAARAARAQAGDQPADPTSQAASPDGTKPPPRQRKPPSEEHRRAIAEAIRAKWQDPEYRARTIQAIHQHVAAKYPGQEIGSRRRRRNPSGEGGGVAAGRAASRAASAAGRDAAAASAAAEERRAREARMAQLQAAVDQIIATRRLVMRVDMEIAAMRVKAAAFVHDPGMAGRAEAQMAQAESMLKVARTKLQLLQDQLPPGVSFDSAGRIVVSGSSSTAAAPAPAPARPQQQELHRAAAEGAEGAVSVQEQRRVAVVSSIADLDPEAMRDPLHAVPDVLGMPLTNGHHHHHGHVNGVHANGVHVNGAEHHHNDHHHHANGHSVANGHSAGVVANGHPVNGHHVNGFHSNGHHHMANGHDHHHDQANGHSSGSNGASNGILSNGKVAETPHLVVPLSAAELLPPQRPAAVAPLGSLWEGEGSVGGVVSGDFGGHLQQQQEQQQEEGVVVVPDVVREVKQPVAVARSVAVATPRAAPPRRRASAGSQAAAVAVGGGGDEEGDELVRSTRSRSGRARR